MCGIVGVANPWLTAGEKDRFKDLLTVSNLRGWQGAGVVIASNKGEVSTFKTIGNGTDLAHDRDMNQRLFHHPIGQGPSIAIGHTRWPTKGQVSLETTHPHFGQGITGVHNGTIDSINGQHIPNTESDSALLYHNIGLHGIHDVIKETRGAWALVYVDEKDNTLNFLRNSKRPLALAYTDAGTMYWASESAMLEFVLGRYVGKFTVVSLKEDTLAVFELPLSHNMKKTRHYTEELKGKSAPVTHSFHGPKEVADTAPFLGPATTAKQETPKASEKSPEVKEGLVIPGKPGVVWCDKMKNWVVKREADIILLPTTVLGPATIPVKSPGTKEKNTSDGGVSPMVNSPSTTETTSPSQPLVQKGAPSTEGDTFPGSDDPDDGQFLDVDAGAKPATLEELFEGTAGADPVPELVRIKPPSMSNFAYRETTRGHNVDNNTYLRFLADGCAWCGDPQPDVATNRWVDKTDYVCCECRSVPENIDMINEHYPQAKLELYRPHGNRQRQMRWA